MIWSVKRNCLLFCTRYINICFHLTHKLLKDISIFLYPFSAVFHTWNIQLVVTTTQFNISTIKYQSGYFEKDLPSLKMLFMLFRINSDSFISNYSNLKFYLKMWHSVSSEDSLIKTYSSVYWNEYLISPS